MLKLSLSNYVLRREKSSEALETELDQTDEQGKEEGSVATVVSIVAICNLLYMLCIISYWFYMRMVERYKLLNKILLKPVLGKVGMLGEVDSLFKKIC